MVRWHKNILTSYEEPVNPEVVVDNGKMSVEESAKKVVEFIIKQAWCEEERR